MKRFIISQSASILEALGRLNELHGTSMTLFATDSLGHMTGTLTDGDIRRALLNGKALNDTVETAMCRNFYALRGKDNVKTLRKLRNKGISLIPRLDESNRITGTVDLTKCKSELPVDAVLMAGGKGERLRPLTLKTPKPLLEIGGKPIIDRNIDRLMDFGIKDIYVTVNYLKEQLIDFYSAPKSNGVKVNCVAEQKFFGTIGALRLVGDFKNDTILVMNSDLLTDIDYEDFYLHFVENGAMMSAAAIPYTISVPYGIFMLEGRNITGVHEKPVYNHYANAGIYLIRREALSLIPEGEVFNATDLINALTETGNSVIRYPLTGLWMDIGTPEEYHKAQDLVKHLK